jgi:integrase
MSNKAASQTGRIKIITSDQFNAILGLAKRHSPRDYLLLFLCGNLGLRVSELIRLRVTDLGSGQIRIPKLKIMGRSKDGRIKKNEIPEDGEWIALPNEIRVEIEKYLTHYRIGAGFIFPGRDGHLTRMSAQDIFYRYAKKIGINASIHSLRHFRGSTIYSQYKDIYAVALALRHKSLESSKVYATTTMETRSEMLRNAGIITGEKGR